MADGVFSRVLESLNQLLEQDADLLLGVEDQLSSFQAQFKLMRSLHRDCEGKSHRSGSVKMLTAVIRDAALDTEDIIDVLVPYVAKQRGRGRMGRLFNQLAHERMLKNVLTRMEIIKMRFDEMNSRKEMLITENMELAYGRSERERTGWRHSFFLEPDCLVGFVEEAMTLVHQLVGGEPKRDVIPIIGMGGSGKTVLAMKIYTDVTVSKHFDVCAWVHVSQDWRARELLLRILWSVLKGVDPEVLNEMNDDDLKAKVLECLRGMRYLIVMDDMWGKEAWDEVKACLPDSLNGSRILITSRDREVGSHASPSRPPHSLRLLNEHESWELLSRHAFPGGICPTQLEELGRQIAEKCKGLPLSIMVLGGVLSRKERTIRVWERMSHNVNEHITEGASMTLQILDLSFENLPSYLKSCSLYFGMFPDDSEIPVRKLTKLWIAEGFIPEKGSRKMEDVAAKYVEELIDQTIIQVARSSTDGGVKTCIIHPLFQNLLISKGKDQKFLEVYHQDEYDYNFSPGRTRRIAIHGHTPPFASLALPIISSGVRSFQWFCPDDAYNCHFSTREWRVLYQHFKWLRVLNLDHVYVRGVPKQIEELVQLRYLSLSTKAGVNIPPSLCNLHNLQTLDMSKSDVNCMLPNVIWKMQALRHLYLPLHTSLASPTWGSSDNQALLNLQTLSTIVPRRESKLFMVMAKFPNVTKLGLSSSIQNDTVEFLRSLDHLNHLQSLKVVGPADLPDPNAFPLTLTKITLRLTGLGADVGLKTLENLPNLRILKLLEESVKGPEISCNAGGFPQLQVLKMSKLDTERWTMGRRAMWSLRRLIIDECVQLTVLPDGLWRTKALREVEVFQPSPSLQEMLQQLIVTKDWCQIQIHSLHNRADE